MAEYGLRVYNPETGSIQIDQDYRNMEVLAIETVTTKRDQAAAEKTWYVGDWYTNTNYSTAVPSYSGQYSFVVLVGNRFASSRYNPEGIGKKGLCVKAPAGTQVTLLVFGYPSNESPPTGYGLVVYNEDGEICFNSNKKYLRVVDILSGANHSSLVSKSYPAGRTYACVTLSSTGSMQRQYINQIGLLINFRFWETVMNIRMNGNILEKEVVQVTGPSGRYYNYHVWPGNKSMTYTAYVVMVLDITNFL